MENSEFVKNTLSSFLDLSELPIKQTILLVDDEINNLQLLKRTFRSEYNILTASNGEEALNIVKEQGENIALIVSDQKMPVMEGTELFKQVSLIQPQIIKILLTGHVDTDILSAAINECNLYQYILKPFEPEELKITVNNGINKYEMESHKRLMLKDLRELFYKTIKSISSALDAKDAYTNGHSFRVTLYSLIIAKDLNLSDDLMEEIETAGLLHDIGKIGIPKSILSKNGKLTDEEYEIMKKHPEQGEKIVMNVQKLIVIANWLKSHHEKWDGTGYPQGLKGEEIPISARIIAIADTYDAMTSTRPYRTALSHEIAVAEISKCSGTQFDPNLVEIFLRHQDEIAEAKSNPEEIYSKLSFLQKHINSKIPVALI